MSTFLPGALLSSTQETLLNTEFPDYVKLLQRNIERLLGFWKLVAMALPYAFI